jgi:hypothetical protein
MNDETRYVLNRELIRLDKLIKEAEQDAKSLTIDVAKKYVDIASYQIMYKQIKDDLDA